MTSKYLYTWMQRMAALLLVFIGSSAFAVADTKLYIEDFSISAGETKEVAVCLDTDVDDFRMTSMTITLPTGLSFETVDIGLGKPVIAATVNTSRAVGFSAIGSPETGKISMSSLSGNIAAGTGTLFTFKVKAADNLAVTSTIQLVGGELTRRGDGSKYNEANNNLEIGNATVNKLGDLSVKFAEETITMDPSGTYSMAVNMSNIGKAVVGFQADLVLPAGWTATITDGRLINSGTGYRIQYNDLTTPIPGEEGTIFTINLVAPSTFTTGSVEVKLKDIFVTVGTSEQQLADAKLTVNANGGTIPGKPVVTFTKPSAVIGGGKTGKVDVNMLNVGLDVKGFQADIVLPEGWTVQVVNGRMINMGSGNRVMYSDFMNSIPGEDGILFSLALTPSESFVSGDAIVKLTNILTTVGFKEEALSDISITVNAATLNNIVNEALADATEDVVIVTMDGDNLCDGAVVVPTGKQLVLDGANHSLTLGEATNFTICDGITIKNVNIDAAALTKPLVQMNGTPEFEPVESGQYVIKNAITIDNVKVTGLTKNLFSDGGKGYAYDQFNINNSVFEYATQAGVVLNLAASMAINFNITNSTFYSKEAGTANFIAMSGKRPWQITGYEDETGKLTVANNTFYNVAKSKQFMNTNTLKGQKYLYEFNSNIFANVSNKKIYGNMTNNKKQLTTDGKNTYFFDGEFFAETNYNGDEGLKTDPAFADAAAGDFTIGASTKQAKFATGDPRWVVEYVKPAFSALVAEALAAVAEGNATLTLEEDYTVDAAVTVPAGKQLVLDGANHSLTLGEATNFTICDGITLKNVNIDATALTQPLVQMNKEPQIASVESGQYVVKNAITIDNVKVTGLTKNLFSDGGKGYAYEQFNINNSVFEYATQTGVVLNLAASMAINFNITNSTFYSKEAGTANFIAMSGKRPWQITGYEDETGKLTVANNTFYNVAKSKQFMNTNTLKGQKYLYEFNSNIFANVSNKKIYGNMTNNKKQLTTDGKNTYFFDGEFFAETNYNGDEGLQTDPAFADAAAGDFTIGAITLQAKEKTGDPRWLVEYSKGTFSALVADALAGVESGEATLKLIDDYDVDAAVTVPAGKQLVLDGANHSLTLGEATNFTICDGITIKNVNIDAAALTKPLVQMNGTPEIEPVESGQYVIKNAITFDNVKATGLTKNLFSDNSKAYVYEQFNINNSIFEYSTQTGVVLNLGSSMAINFNITNSTFWSKEAGTANFIAMSGKRPWQVTGYEEETGKMTVANSTFYNVAKSNQFMNTNTLKGQKYLYEFNSNIFANVSKKKIYGNMTNNKKQLTTDGKNTYFFDGEFFAETNYNGDEGLQTDPAFADAAAGDFTIGESTKQAREKTGDPRWLTEFVAPTDVDKTALAATITEAEALTAPAESDPEEVKTAWAAVTDALTKGQAVNADANVFQDEVDAANTALANAIAAYNTATGITDINIDNNTVAGEKDVYYNLQGVRVANPGKGIYIKNGKKVLVK